MSRRRCSRSGFGIAVVLEVKVRDVEASVSVLRIDGESFLVFGFGLLPVSCAVERGAECGEGSDIIWCVRQNPAVESCSRGVVVVDDVDYGGEQSGSGRSNT